MRFEIGQEVWRATFDAVGTRVTCPDCGGTLTLHVTLFDGREFDIPCETCKGGWDGPRGYLESHERQPLAHCEIITGMSIESGKTEWRTASSYIIEDRNLFLTQEEALVRAAELAAEWDADERERLRRRENPARSWAWHVTYHRGCIKRAECDLEYHTRQLAFARTKAKEPKVVETLQSETV